MSNKKRKFKVKIQTVKEYEITIDEDIMNKTALDDFELYVHELKKENDRIKSMAHDYCYLRFSENDDFIDGYGYVLENGQLPKNAEFRGIKQENINRGIDFKAINDGEYPNITVTEIV